MKTNDFINALAQDHAARPQPEPLRWTFLTAMAAGLGVAAVAFALTLGVRPDVASAILTWRYDFKFVVTLTLAVTSARLVWRLARPAADPRSAELAMAAAPLLLFGGGPLRALGGACEQPGCRAPSARTPWPAWSVSRSCRLAPLAAAFYALRRGAPLAAGFGGCGGRAARQRACRDAVRHRIARTTRRCSAPSGTQPQWRLSLAREALPGRRLLRW